MTEDEIIEVLKAERGPRPEGDDVLLGLNILRKYSPEPCVIEAVVDELLLCTGLAEAAQAGITRVEVELLRDTGWFHYADDSCFSHYV